MQQFALRELFAITNLISCLDGRACAHGTFTGGFSTSRAFEPFNLCLIDLWASCLASMTAMTPTDFGTGTRLCQAGRRAACRAWRVEFTRPTGSRLQTHVCHVCGMRNSFVELLPSRSEHVELSSCLYVLFVVTFVADVWRFSRQPSFDDGFTMLRPLNRL